MKSFDDLPLRQRKYAKTRLGLMNALLTALQTTTLEKVQIKDLCRAAEISEASFFNYFPKKQDLLAYFIQIWSLEVTWYSRVKCGKKGLAAVEEIFRFTARKVTENPAVMREILAYQASGAPVPHLEPITLAEKLLAFPDHDKIEDIEGIGLEGILPGLFQEAVTMGQLPKNTDLQSLLLTVSSVFFGVPVIALRVHPAMLETAYLSHLALIWKGLGAKKRK